MNTPTPHKSFLDIEDDFPTPPSLDDIARICAYRKDELKDFWKKLSWKQATDNFYLAIKSHTQDEFGCTPRSYEDFRKVLGRQCNHTLGKLRTFIDLYQFTTSRKCVTELPISTCSQKLIHLFGSWQNVSNLLVKAQKIGLLKCIDDKFVLKQSAKRYIYNKESQDIIKSIVKERKISYKRYIKENVIYKNNSANLQKQIPDNIKERIRVGTNLWIPIKGSCPQEVIKQVLEMKYPQAVEQIIKANEMNRQLNSAEQISAEWNLHISDSGKYLMKIGFRMTSGIVSLKAHQDIDDERSHKKVYTGVWRKDYLRQQLGKVYAFDVKSSIFRLTYNLNHNDYLDDNLDVYAVLHGRAFCSEAERNCYKLFKMRTYFDKFVAKHIMPVFDPLFSDDIKTAVADDVTSEYAYLGRHYDSEIFLHESCIYNELVYRLRKKGIRIVQIYDGFYSNVNIAEMCKAELQTILIEYKAKLASGEYQSHAPSQLESPPPFVTTIKSSYDAAA